MQTMYYIGLDVHKKKISYCVKDGSGHIHAEGAIPAARSDLDRWMKTLPAPWTAAMEATIFTGWIYDHRHEVRRADDGLLIPNLVMEELPTIRGLIVTSAFIDADHKLISNQKARDSQYAVSCSSIAGVSRRS